MPDIVQVEIESDGHTRVIELKWPADKVTITFDNERTVTVTPEGVDAGEGHVLDMGGLSGGNTAMAADNGSIVQNVRSGRDSYVAGRDGYFSR